MTSLTQIAYSSRVRRHGRSRAFLSNHTSSFLVSECRNVVASTVLKRVRPPCLTAVLELSHTLPIVPPFLFEENRHGRAEDSRRVSYRHAVFDCQRSCQGDRLL